jgi:hypothetical protein
MANIHSIVASQGELSTFDEQLRIAVVLLVFKQLAEHMHNHADLPRDIITTYCYLAPKLYCITD